MQISNYRVIEAVYTGSRTLVYRAVHIYNELPVVIKLLRNEYPTFSELVQFRNQYAISKHFNSPLIIKTYSLEPYCNSYALVMEDFQGISLQEWISKEKKSLSLADFLEIAIALCQALELLYQEQIIHKDIKPANILINPETKQVKLIDFSIASLLPRETQEIKNANALEGTLAYISPEQTGRMNRGIDYRTDFYSLGVTFYELLTGELPFQSNDPMELIHAHIAKLPPLVHEVNPEIPLVLSAIVMKLMAKNAEDRYQSALGLKFDLEKCLAQLQSTDRMPGFVIGERDLCDRFIIPEKLYGRETEVQALLEAFARVSQGATEMMLVAGFSGIGKTAVVNEVHKPIVRQRGYFIKGKYDQFQRNIPFSAFVQAFRDLMGQLLSESDTQLQIWKEQILAAVGENGQVLIEVIPELENILGKQPPPPELSGSAVQNRFNLLIQKFIQIFTSEEHPLVIFLDDLQWADSASLKLLQLLMQEAGHLLVLGAYRDNEVSPLHSFLLTVDEIIKTGATVHTITLLPLNKLDINQLVADTLNYDLLTAQPLTELVYQKTLGNPFFATQFLKALYEEKQITFNLDTHCWLCDLDQVKILALTDDVVEFMALQLQKLPQRTQDFLKLAACIGAQFDLQTLAIISESSLEETATTLWRALQEGLIIPNTESYKFFIQSERNEPNETSEILANPSYRFLHDRVQQAAYSLIPETHKAEIHYRIGHLLLSHFSAATQEERIFEIVGQLNLGKDLIFHPLEGIELAKLNLLAGEKAMLSTAYGAALEYLNQGIDILPEDAWLHHYDFTLKLHNYRLEAAYLSTNFEDLTVWGELVLQRAVSDLDRIKVYETRSMALRAQGRFLEVVETGLQVLQLLGFAFPLQPTSGDITAAYEQLQQICQGYDTLRLLALPAMEDPRILAAMQIMTKIVPSAHIAASGLIPLLTFKQVELSIQYGNCPVSIFSYADYGLILCGFMGDTIRGYEFGNLSLALLEKLQVTPFKSRAYFIVNSFIRHWQEPLQNSLPLLLEGYQSGLESGDWECVALNLLTYSNYKYWAGQELQGLAVEMENYRQVIDRVRQEATLISHEVYLQAVLNLLGQAEIPYRLQGDVFDADQSLPFLEAINDQVGLFHVYLNQAILCYLFEQNDQAAHYTALLAAKTGGATGFFITPIYIFYDALIQLRCYPAAPIEQQAIILEQVAAHQVKLQGWAINAPANHQHRWQLVAAEQHRVLGQQYAAIDLYDYAILQAKENEYVQDEALANELAAKFYLDWGKKKIAQVYMIEAYYCYARWGAKAKIEDLEARYPQLIESILPQSKNSFDPLATLINITHTAPLSSSPKITDYLDFLSVLKATQALSSEIQLKGLLQQLTQIILQNSGADKCVLVLLQEETWQVKAISTPGFTEIYTESLTEPLNVPIKIIQLIKRTQAVVISDNLKTDLPIIDDYLIQYQPKSILGLPILNQGSLVGIIYLENRSTAGVFTSDRLTIINFLCTQAAISLENARLYQQSQNYAQQLEQSQLQIVQSEKMSALGNLVAGVAHEMNNPLGFIAASLQQAKPTFEDILEHLKLYQEKFPHKSPEIIDHESEIDLAYNLQDLPKTIDSLVMACNRLKNISTSLRTFSRTDQDYKVPFHIYEGIDSTILILKHRLKANNQHPEIEVITEYGNIPQIQCFPGQLNQVFMNILANAIDALEESNQGRSFAEIEANPNKITITTMVVDRSVQISIMDNGKGMSEEVKSKIFDHLFTTKSVGKGTGLGLAIARQIVEEKHGGTLEVVSKLGQGTEFIILLPLG